MLLSLPRRGRVAVRRTAGWGIAQSFIDNRENAFQIPIYFIVPDTQHIKPLPEKMTIALRIKLPMAVEIVLAAINLDHQPMFQANEVRNEVVAWGLATKVVTALAPRAQVHPQLHFLGVMRFRSARATSFAIRPRPGRPTADHPPPSGER